MSDLMPEQPAYPEDHEPFEPEVGFDPRQTARPESESGAAAQDESDDGELPADDVGGVA